MCFCKAHEVKDTGDTFRSYDLGVMSPARYLCATPVKDAAFNVQLDIRESGNYVIRPHPHVARFMRFFKAHEVKVYLLGVLIRPTSQLWAARSASELRGFSMCSSALMHQCDV